MPQELDNISFVEKHQRKPLFTERKRPDAFQIFLVTSLFFIYVSVFLLTLTFLDLTLEMVLLIAGVFVAFTVLTYAIHRALFWRRRQIQLLDLLRQVFEGSRGARMVTDEGGAAFHYNRNFIELLRRSDREFEYVSLQALVDFFSENPEAETHLRLLAEQSQRGLTNSTELYTTLKNEDCWFEVTVQPVPEWPGHIHWRIDDVTDKRATERGIREEREKLIDFTDNAPVGFFSTDEEGRFVFVNATFARWVGEDIATLLSEGRLHTYLEDKPQNAAPYDVKTGGGVRQITEVTMKGPAGKTFWAAINQTVVEEPDGRVRTRAVVNDLTAERSMRQALKASEDKFQRFFDEAPLGIAILNQEGLLEECNSVLEQMIGATEDALAGYKFEKMLQQEDRSMVMSDLGRLERQKRMQAPKELQLVGMREGEPIPVKLYARKFKESPDIVLHFIDMTQQKVLEEQFVQSQKMQAIGQLAGGVAHDFNNLLTAMVGFCDLLLLRHKPGDPSFGDIMQIKQNANRAANLVRQLLAFSRQQTLTPKVHDVTDILSEVSHLLRRLIGANIELEVFHGTDKGLIKVDESQMEQVLINLAVNARDAMGEDTGGKLNIRTFIYDNDDALDLREDEMPPGHWVGIEVADTGCGIPEENLNRVLEPFFTTKDVGQGTGLGLATVYGIIRQTGGYLHVESEIGEGTTFTIYLPRIMADDLEDSATAEAEAEEDEPKDLTGTACILLVEDEDAVRTFSTRALANKGYEVLAAESGERALDVIKEDPEKHIDLLVTDVVMPNMDGPTLAQRLRQEHPELKIIFISGYTEDRLKDHMGENISFLPKPFTLKQLAEKVKEVLDS